MKKNKRQLKGRELERLGIPPGEARKLAYRALARAAKEAAPHTAPGKPTRQHLEERLSQVVADPAAHRNHPIWAKLAQHLEQSRSAPLAFSPRQTPAPYHQWGSGLEAGAVKQMENACNLPVARRGALMPDAHLGYGLPIGGVLATAGVVIPYAVGMDIACRMRLSVMDLPLNVLDRREQELIHALERETRFGVGASFKKQRRQHPVMDEDWAVTRLTRHCKDLAWAQLGTSGSGNHFVEFGELTLDGPGLDLEPGSYLALLSHSGSRGTGGKVAKQYSQAAMDLHPELPREMRHLAWLDLDSSAGQEYWAAMELMGRYAMANHKLIHKHVLRAISAQVLLELENHHNFAWKEEHDKEQVIVHRKGATPAGSGTLGIIPGSMGTHAFVVRGKGNALSLNSASHGAGRKMSRTQAKKSFTWHQAKEFLAQQGVKLISAGLDEVPMAYKDIDEVMAAQQDLVQPLARFQPRLVKMAPEKKARSRRGRG